ncbi:hypothetical protein B0A48_04897 [Cryoendolithus antarcticus]|uniref:E3 ubiquitin-protein ligase PEP5 n=1 Tax=Cryoendolithus antarcticus TaxID=1507870 RepID=A0A1V8TDP0_9PEZI|nr:hypothetical protein B0A48_04897 [Cryoendolithus antarcticus]
MALTSWKQFRFFDVSQVRLLDGDGTVALDQGSVSCVAAGADRIYAGTPDGTIHSLDQSFKPSRTWQAHSSGSVSHIRQLPGTSYLLSIAEDLVHEPELKVWALDQLEKKTQQPRCLCTVSIQNGRKNFPVSAFAVTGDLAQLAVGFANGAVTVVRGDLIHDRGTKQRTVFESEEPITGLEFREANTVALYIATTARIAALAISGKGQGSPARTLDEHGCAVGCMTLDPDSREIIVARDDAVYTYGPQGRAASYAYEGAKKLVGISGDYVLIVSPPNTGALAKSVPLRAFAQATDILNTSSFTILDTDLKFIAYSESLSAQVSSLFSIWGDIFLLTIDGKLYRYHEKTFQQKLEILYQRDLYMLAINLAQKYKVDTVQQNAISRKHGDYLYQKGDYDTAMQQYLSAIDNTEPSQIIRKYLDNQRIKNLIDYLEELHEHHKATSDHTTLLLNCYAKLKDVEKLEAFIKQPGNLRFDLDTAIIMCRQAGYFDQAAFLARRHNEHGLVVDILIEDLKKYAEAIAYIQRLQPADAYSNFTKYGTVLLEHCPIEATQIFIDYFTGTFRPKKDTVIIQETPTDQERGGGFVTTATSAVQNLAALIPLPYMNSSSVHSPSDGETQKQAQIIETTMPGEFVEYEVPKPRVAFSAFIDHPDAFITFLEALLASEDLQSSHESELTATLFELYLHKASATRNEEKTEYERRARALIESPTSPIDPSSILLLSDLEKFRAGTVLVSESQNLHADIFRSYASAQDTRGAIRALQKYGPRNPSLYPAALAYFTSTPQILADAGTEVTAVLKKIDEENLMSPLQVIQILSQNAVATMALVKSYLSTTVARERAEITQNRRLITSYRNSTTETLASLDTLNTEPTSFSATRCSSCAKTLDLPTVHFLCKHSFHARCLNVAPGQESEVECPLCAAGNDTVRALRTAQVESSRRDDLFTDALSRSGERFGVVGEWFGRGVMGVRTQGKSQQVELFL